MPQDRTVVSLRNEVVEEIKHFVKTHPDEIMHFLGKDFMDGITWNDIIEFLIKHVEIK
ncbi:MAG: hypothetical protein QXU18_10985 [Thermoplasmatales archaeon]